MVRILLKLLYFAASRMFRVSISEQEGRLLENIKINGFKL